MEREACAWRAGPALRHSPRAPVVPVVGLATPTCSPRSELVLLLLCSHHDSLEGGAIEVSLTHRGPGPVDAHSGPRRAGEG